MNKKYKKGKTEKKVDTAWMCQSCLKNVGKFSQRTIGFYFLSQRNDPML